MFRLRYLWAAVLVTLVCACVEQEPFRPTEDDKRKIRENILAKAPPMKFKVNADLEGKVIYLGLDVDRDVIKPGEQFKLTHYWQVKKKLTGWRLYVHLNSEGKRDYINADHRPVGGKYPVTLWKPGEIVRDIHQVTLPGNWKSDKVTIYTGLWKPKNLRMKIKGAQDDESRIIAATMPVVGGKPAPAVTLKRLTALRTTKPIIADGKLDEEAWAKAASTGPFVETVKGGKSPVATEAKILWDDKYLYIGVSATDEDVWSKYTKRDDKLWLQEVIEVFIDANNDGKDYVELQANPNKAIFDSYFKAYRQGNDKWNSKMLVGVQVDGKVNDNKDKDKGWTVELAIPWVDTVGEGKTKLTFPPKVGTKMRINIYRLDNPRGKPQIFSGWSAPMKGDLHAPDRFGEVYFADDAGKLPEAPKAPAKGAKAPAKEAKTVVAKEKLPPNVVRIKDPPVRPTTLKDRIPVRIHPSKIPVQKKAK